MLGEKKGLFCLSVEKNNVGVENFLKNNKIATLLFGTLEYAVYNVIW